ncbi:hypothetical protein N4T77_12055 [Clostridium sp. CX1]|uniref:Uncharacterized protein n=1 Tax=Clostridium tanneri TaxID=3037988 RepID=A0ABU4JXP9_9CLOT|nr:MULTISPECIES: hypothetical protein [unclassified Clostridium]MCT8977334.1 hypothetical protein [Clostridium sp. CX1]MDW8802939.1 hypothetical protein [Clostridium sp. A1-XYC3]
MIMEECPFLSTYENDVECFKDCALYNYKGTGGICPFKNVPSYKMHRVDSEKSDLDFLERDLNFIRETYLERHNQYL